jgi:hypothetical protein
MKRLFIIGSILALFTSSVFWGCKKDKDDAVDQTITKTIKGSAQKGPFLIGTSITVNELDLYYNQTGKSFSTQIINNVGSFQIDNATLITPYVSIRADGFYFNEVCGSNSISQLTLWGISNISSPTDYNINLLTHLEKPRVEYLLGTGLPFDSAKKVAQADVLNIFNMTDLGIQNSEYLDIANSGNGNGILLAISAILQGFRTESELSSILSTISIDIESDGVLNNTSTMSSLIDHALLLDTISIRNNITNYYLNFGITPSIPNFEYYIQQFINNTAFPATNSVISYPATGAYGDNILNKNQLIYNGFPQSMKANLKRCSQLKIRIYSINGLWVSSGGHVNWNFTVYNTSTQEAFYSTINPELPNDASIGLQAGGTYLIEYFESNASIVTFSKTITVN